MNDVNDIPDDDLLGRAVRGAKPRLGGKARQGRPRWTCVMDLFGLGSTYARQLCRKYGVDPDEMVR